jgi:hypothetical protein
MSGGDGWELYMSIFKPNYNKPGPGVEKNEPPKPGYIRFWILYFRNFNKMLLYGAVYFVVAVPLICFVFYLITMYVNPQIAVDFYEAMENASKELAPEGETVIISSWFIILFTIITAVPPYISLPLVAISAIVFGPINCGIVYCMRNHAREEHAWFSDIFVRAWRNVKQGLFFGFLDLAVIISAFIYLFSPDTLGLPDWLFAYLRLLALGIFLVYLIMRWYIYQMAVTFNLRILGILKNAWVFVILGLGRNLIAGVLSVLFIAFWVLFPLFYPATMPFVLLMMLSLFWSMLWFLQVFTTYPVMHKYLVAPALAEQKKKEMAKRRAEAQRRKEAGEPLDEDLEEPWEEETEEEAEGEIGAGPAGHNGDDTEKENPGEEPGAECEK